MSRKTQITVPEDIDQIIKEYKESQLVTQGELSWTQALLQLVRKGYQSDKK
jgi:hypothetical protein